MKWMLLGVGVMASVALIVFLVGTMLPRDHVATGSLTLRRGPSEVWALITDRAWNKRVAGDLPLDVVESKAPERLVMRVADPNLPFGGTWTYTITPTSGGATLQITEEGYVSNPVFRFVSRFVIGHHKTIDTYLQHVARQLG